MIEKSCSDFVGMLASSSPVPGGGGASALVGALGIALGSMVGNLTLGKKKYESVRDDIAIILEKAAKLQLDLLGLVEEDAVVFEPLSKAYRLPRDTDEEKRYRDDVMEIALKNACDVPVRIIKKILETIPLLKELSVKGTKIAISDIGVGALLCKSALLGASLNVFINTRLMKNRSYADETDAITDNMLKEGVSVSDGIYRDVVAQIRG